MPQGGFGEIIAHLILKMKKLAIVFSIIMCMLACTKPSDDREFIRSMYEESLYEDYTFLEQHCSKDLLEKLSEEYDYEGGGYAVWLFRSGALPLPRESSSRIKAERTSLKT